MVAILVNGPIDFFMKNIDSLINADMTFKGKISNSSYAALHQLLCGKFYFDSLENTSLILNKSFVKGSQYAYTTREITEQSASSAGHRLNSIGETFFLKRKAAMPTELWDLCVDIVLQMAANKY